MKKAIFTILMCVMVAASAAAAVQNTEDESYRNLDQLKRRLIRMQKEINNFAQELAAPYSESGPGLTGGFGMGINVDVAEDDKDVIVKADLPGMEKDKIEITLDQGKILTIAGSRSVNKEESAPGVVKQERMQGSFKRVLELPSECLNSGIKATYDNGVLDIVIPKKEMSKAEPVKIAVQ